MIPVRIDEATNRDALAAFDQWLRDNEWYKWRAVEYDAATRRYLVDEGHVDYFLKEAQARGVRAHRDG